MCEYQRKPQVLKHHGAGGVILTCFCFINSVLHLSILYTCAVNVDIFRIPL